MVTVTGHTSYATSYRVVPYITRTCHPDFFLSPQPKPLSLDLSLSLSLSGLTKLSLSILLTGTLTQLNSISSTPPTQSHPFRFGTTRYFFLSHNLFIMHSTAHIFLVATISVLALT
jgi:hypothetical protein